MGGRKRPVCRDRQGKRLQWRGLTMIQSGVRPIRSTSPPAPSPASPPSPEPSSRACPTCSSCQVGREAAQQCQVNKRSLHVWMPRCQRAQYCSGFVPDHFSRVLLKAPPGHQRCPPMVPSLAPSPAEVPRRTPAAPRRSRGRPMCPPAAPPPTPRGSAGTAGGTAGRSSSTPGQRLVLCGQAGRLVWGFWHRKTDAS